MDQPGTETAVELREYLTVLRMRKWSVILTTVLIVGGALAYSYWQTPLYAASARVLINPPQADPRGFVAPQIVDSETESQILASEPVAEMVRADLRLEESVDALLGPLRVDPVPDSRVLEVTYTTVDPARARDLANAFSDSYIQYRRTQVLDALATEQEAIQQQIDDVSRELERLDRQIGEAEAEANSALADTLASSRNVLLARLGVLEQQRNDLQPDAALVGSGDVIESAKLPSRPSSPNHILNGILGLLIGLPLGVALAFTRERLDDRFRGRADVERAVQAPVLATIPRFPKAKRQKGAAPQTVMATQPSGFASESYRSLRTGLLFLVTQKEIKSILVTSPSEGEGKTVTTANLGVTLAQAGTRVILLSSDLRRPGLETYFGLSHREGISDWLISGFAEPWSYLQDAGIPNLRIFPAGSIPSNPAELLSSPRFVEMLRLLESHSDLVLLDSPPVFPVADPVILAGWAGGTLLVIDATRTHRSAAKRASQEIERSGGTLIGAVLNAFDPSASPYYYYDYYPYYGRYSSYEKRSTPDNGDGEAQVEGRKRKAFRRGR